VASESRRDRRRTAHRTLPHLDNGRRGEGGVENRKTDRSARRVQARRHLESRNPYVEWPRKVLVAERLTPARRGLLMDRYSLDRDRVTIAQERPLTTVPSTDGRPAQPNQGGMSSSDMAARQRASRDTRPVVVPLTVMDMYHIMYYIHDKHWTETRRCEKMDAPRGEVDCDDSRDAPYRRGTS